MEVRSLRWQPEVGVVGQFGFVGRAILPQPAFSRLWPPKKAACSQDWPPHKGKLTDYRSWTFQDSPYHDHA